jgi:hypothetical protein
MLRAMKLIVAIVIVTIVTVTTVALPSYAQDAQTPQELDSGVNETRQGRMTEYRGFLDRGDVKRLEVMTDTSYDMRWKGDYDFQAIVTSQLRNTRTTALTDEKESRIIPRGEDTYIINTGNHDELILRNKSSANATVTYTVTRRPRPPLG